MFYALQTILLQIPEHLLNMKRIATNSKLETSSSILQVPNLDLLYQENGWGQSAFDMKPESRECIESLEPVECEKGRLLGDDQESAKARKEGLTGNEDESKASIQTSSQCNCSPNTETSPPAPPT